MYAVELKSIATDVARDRKTGQIIGIHTDDPLYDPTQHVPVMFEYRENLRTVVSRPPNPQGGASAADFAHGIAIINKLRKAKDGATVLFEDADAGYLKNAVATYPWGLIEWWIGDFCADIAALKPLPEGQVAAALAPVVEQARADDDGENTRHLLALVPTP